MDFKQATDRMQRLGFTLHQMANALGIGHQTIRAMRVQPGTPTYRTAPPEEKWVPAFLNLIAQRKNEVKETEDDFETAQERLNQARAVGQWVAEEVRGLCELHLPIRELRRWVWTFNERANGWVGAFAIEDGDALLNFDPAVIRTLLPRDWVSTAITGLHRGVLVRNDGSAVSWNPETGDTSPLPK